MVPHGTSATGRTSDVVAVKRRSHWSRWSLAGRLLASLAVLGAVLFVSGGQIRGLKNAVPVAFLLRAEYKCESASPFEVPPSKLSPQLTDNPALDDFVARARKWHITYGDERFPEGRIRNSAEATASGLFDISLQFQPANLSAEFRQTFRDILRKGRGGGFWVWKIDIIKQTFAQMADGDFLVYMDAGTSVANHSLAAPRFDYFLKLLNVSSLGLMGFRSGHRELTWTTDAMFHRFGLYKNEAFYGSLQYLANIMIFQKNERSERFLSVAEDILRRDMWIVSNRDEKLTTRDTFRRHRHDQSLFSVLRKCMGTVAMPVRHIWGRQYHDQEPLHGTHIRG